jgi:hypothetical protein
VKDFAVRTFGPDDKSALAVGILVVLALLAVGLGVLARRRLAHGLAGVALFGLAGITASLTRPGARIADIAPSAVAAIVAMATLAGLVRLSGRTSARQRPQPTAAEPTPAERTASGVGPVVAGRRRFLLASLGAAAAGVASGGAGQALMARAGASAARAAITLPRPASPAGPLPPGTGLHIPRLGPYLTSGNSFYRVDTALVLPNVPPQSWQLRIDGMVDRPLQLSFGDLLRRPLTERYIILTLRIQ